MIRSQVDNMSVMHLQGVQLTTSVQILLLMSLLLEAQMPPVLYSYDENVKLATYLYYCLAL